MDTENYSCDIMFYRDSKASIVFIRCDALCVLRRVFVYNCNIISNFTWRSHASAILATYARTLYIFGLFTSWHRVAMQHAPRRNVRI